MNISRLFLLSFLLIGFSSNALAFEFTFGKRFLDYGNGAINLDKVTYVVPKYSYRVVYPQDPVSEYSQEYGGTGTSQVEQTLNFIEPAGLSKLPFYYVEMSNRIEFDNFKLSILSKKKFLKLPPPDEWATVLQKNTKLKNFIVQIGAINGIANEKLADTYKGLMKLGLKEVTQNDFKEIKKGFETWVKTYRKVVR